MYLGIASLANAGPAHHQKIFNGCLGYFQAKPYWWFEKFGPMLQQLGVEYLNGTACHLDLFQTATDPVWGGLTKAERQTYLTAEGWFLEKQLASHNIQKVLLNGRSVLDAFNTQFGAILAASKCATPGGREFEFHQGSVVIGSKTIEVRGWNLNIQSSPGVSTADVKAIGALCR